MRRPLTSLAAVATVAVVSLTACGGGSGAKSTSAKDPKTAFSTGLSGLSGSDALTVTIKLDTTPDKLIGFAKEGRDKLTPAQAQAIATATLVFETKTTDGSKLSDLKAGKSASSRVAFSDGGRSYAELRFLTSAIYAQADVKSLLDLFGQSKTYAGLTRQAARMPAFAKAFVQGQWISLDLNALKALAGQFGGANASASPQVTQKLVADLRGVVGRDVTVTRVGTDTNGDHLKLAAQSRQFITDLMQTISTDIPGAALATGSFKPSSVPEHSVVVDAWVKDSALSKLSIDLVQFAKPSEVKQGDSLPIVLTFDRSGADISKPAGAVPVDTTQLFGLLGSLGSK